MDSKFNTPEEYLDWIMSQKELWFVSSRCSVIRVLDIIRSEKSTLYVHITYRVNGTVMKYYFIGTDPTRPRIFDNEGDAMEAAIVLKLRDHL